MKPYRNRPIRRRRRRFSDSTYIIILLLMIAFLIVIVAGIVKLVGKDSKKPAGNQTKTVASTHENITKSTDNISTRPSSTDKATSEKPSESFSANVTKFDHSAWYLKLVNPTHKIDATPDIELETLKNGYQCDKRIADDLQQMFDDARKEGLNPIICSAFRTHERQVYLFNLDVEAFKKQGYSTEEATRLAATSTAVPGTSEHELGLALDIVSASYQLLNDAQADTPEQKWLMANCYKYGFILRYPKEKEDLTQIMYEPWHYRYVGKEAAKIIFEEDLCLEEFLNKY